MIKNDMIKVITYGTYDLLHYGHIRLLERAKALGDYFIVGITADDFDKNRGKINVQQSLMERIEAVQATGLADEIIIEEYEGQKIDDIRNYDVDIFTVGSDWKGKFDYLNEYGTVYINGDDDMLRRIERVKHKRPVTFGVGYRNDYCAEQLRNSGLSGSEVRIRTSTDSFTATIHLPGEHMIRWQLQQWENNTA